MIAERWFADQPDRTSVVRTEDGIAGFAYHIFCPTGSTMEDRDPVVRAVLGYVARTAPARPGERVDITRFVAGVREYQRDVYAVLAGSVSSIIDWCTEPLAWSFDGLHRRGVLGAVLRLPRLPRGARGRARRSAASVTRCTATTGGAFRSTPGSS